MENPIGNKMVEDRIIELLVCYTEELWLNKDNEESKVWLKTIVRDLAGLLTGEEIAFAMEETQDDDG